MNDLKLLEKYFLSAAGFLAAFIAFGSILNLSQSHLNIISGALLFLALFLLWQAYSLQKKYCQRTSRPNSIALTDQTVPQETLTKILSTFQDSLINIVRDKFPILSNQTGNFGPEKLISIYQFGSTAPTREEFSIYTSNINILCIVANDAIQNEIVTNLSTIEEAVAKELKDYTLRIFTSYHEDKHSPSYKNEIKMYLLIRGATYLTDKTANQPFFVLNISKDYKLLFGEDHYKSVNLQHVKSLINYDSLVFGMGGLHEMIVFLADSGLLINKDSIAYLRSLKYALVRCCQLAIFFELGEHLTKTSDVLIHFRDNKLDAYNLEFEENDRLHSLLETIIQHTYFVFINKTPAEMAKYHKTVLRLLVATKSQMAELEQQRKRDYSSFYNICEMKKAAHYAYHQFRKLNSCSHLVFTTHSLDDIALCLAFFDLAQNDSQITSAKITIHESPSLMKEFGLKNSSMLFNFPDDLPTPSDNIKNTLTVYIGSRTIYGNFLYTTINTLSNRTKISTSQLRWGYILLNVNPNNDSPRKWLKKFNNTYRHIKPPTQPELSIAIDKNNVNLMSQPAGSTNERLCG